jgi:hypothetical protein
MTTSSWGVLTDDRTQQVNNIKTCLVAPQAAKGHNLTKQVRTMLIATPDYQEVKHRKFVAQHQAMAEKKKNKSKKK